MQEIEERLLQVEAHFTSFVRFLSEHCPYAKPIQIGGFCGFATEIPHFLGCAIAPLPDASVDDIPEVLAMLKARGKPAFWATGIRSQQVGIVSALEKSGLGFGPPSPGMSLDFENFVLPNLPDGCEITQITNSDEAKNSQRVVCKAFEIPPEIGEMLSSLAACDPDRCRIYNLVFEGKTVGSSFALEADGIIGIYNVGVDPGFRGRGFGAAIAAAPILDFRERGITRAILHSSNMGYRVYQSLGFRDAGTYQFGGFQPETTEERKASGPV